MSRFRLGNKVLIACRGLSVGLSKKPIKTINAEQNGKAVSIAMSDEFVSHFGVEVESSNVLTAVAA